MKNNQLDNFENFIKNSLSQNEIPFDPSDWESLNKRLDLKKSKPFYKSNWFLAASVILGVAMSITTYILVNANTKELVSINNDSSSENESLLIKNNNLANEGLTEEVENNLDENSNNFAKEEFLNAEKSTPNENIISETDELNDIEPIDSNFIVEHSTIDEIDQFESDSKTEKKDEESKPEIITLPNADFYSNNVDGCEGTTILFTAEKQKNVEYLWKFDDGNFSNEMNPNHTYTKAGKYSVTLIVRSNLDRSVLKKSIEQTITIHPNPKINFTWEQLEENGIPYISFENNTENGADWNWSFGDGTKSADKNPIHTYRKKGSYSIALVAKSNQNCISTINKEVTITDDYNLLAPNSFTPNGDGTNDYFIPAALNRLNCRFIMTIYSASDGLIYETENINQPWDGINQKTGERCKEGQYVWVVKLTNQKGEIENYKGALLLLK